MLIEGWTFIEALYMTVITMATIGFSEVRPLSTAGRLFTLALIAFGVITATYSISVVIEFFTSADLQEQLHTRRRRKALAQITEHCIICGFGRMGRSRASELKIRNASFIIIDQTDEAIEKCHHLGLPALQGNAADERILREAGIERASSLVAAANSDAENVFIILTAKSIRPDLQIIARTHSEASIPKLEKAGANTVISPYATAGRRVAQLLTHPNVTSFLDGVLEFGDQQMRLEEFVIGPHSPLAGLTLRQAQLEVTVLAVLHPEQTLLSHPNAETKLLPGAAIIVMGIDSELNKLAQMVKG
jgi:voltage-gated potassium channel